MDWSTGELEMMAKLIFVTNATIDGGVLFSSWCTFFAKRAHNFGLFDLFELVCCEFTHILVYFLGSEKMRWCTKVDKHQVWMVGMMVMIMMMLAMMVMTRSLMRW